MRALTLLLAGCLLGLSKDPYSDDGDVLYAGSDSGGSDDVPDVSVSLTGRTYAITADALTITTPAGLDALKSEFLSSDILVYVSKETDVALGLSIALSAADGSQSPCEAVRAMPDADWSANPSFAAGPGELEASFGGEPAAFRDLYFDGTFDGSGDFWSDGTLSAVLDTRELDSALPDMDICALIGDLGGECKACSDGEVACFDLEISDITAEVQDIAFDPSVDGSDCRF